MLTLLMKYVGYFIGANPHVPVEPDKLNEILSNANVVQIVYFVDERRKVEWATF